MAALASDRDRVSVTDFDAEGYAGRRLELSRQSLRRMGLAEIRRQCRLAFPLFTRREVHALSQRLHKEAWDKRDVEAVKRTVNVAA